MEENTNFKNSFLVELQFKNLKYFSNTCNHRNVKRKIKEKQKEKQNVGKYK